MAWMESIQKICDKLTLSSITESPTDKVRNTVVSSEIVTSYAERPHKSRKNKGKATPYYDY